MFVVIVERVVKTNTHATEKFAPRTANVRRKTVSGPFASFRTAQRAAVTALGTHTCLLAQVWSEAQVRERQTRGYARNGQDMQDVLDEALALLDAAATAVQE